MMSLPPLVLSSPIATEESHGWVPMASSSLSRPSSLVGVLEGAVKGFLASTEVDGDMAKLMFEQVIKRSPKALEHPKALHDIL